MPDAVPAPGITTTESTITCGQVRQVGCSGPCQCAQLCFFGHIRFGEEGRCRAVLVGTLRQRRGKGLQPFDLGLNRVGVQDLERSCLNRVFLLAPADDC